MDENVAELRDNAMGEVARTFGRAAGKHHHVAARKGGAHGAFERRLVIGEGAERHRLAARLGHGGGDDRAVAVVDAGRRQWRAGRDELVAGREHGDARPPHHRDLREPARREHADLA